MLENDNEEDTLGVELSPSLEGKRNQHKMKAAAGDGWTRRHEGFG